VLPSNIKIDIVKLETEIISVSSWQIPTELDYPLPQHCTRQDITLLCSCLDGLANIRLMIASLPLLLAIGML
jgi:hypothetical protein